MRDARASKGLEMLNRCEFIGNVGKPPEVRFTGANPVANFSVACNEKWKDKAGNTQERTEWVRCVAWGKLAEIVGSYVEKGKLVYVAGRMQTREYEKDGAKRYSTEIVVETLKLLGSKNDRGGAPAPDRAPAGGPPSDDDLPF